jgi:hypothetical protein
MAALFLIGLIVAAAVAAWLWRYARRRPERAALLVAAVVVSFALIATCVQVADGIRDSRVEWTGKLDAADLHLRPRPGYGHVESAQAVVSNPHPGSGAVAWWALGELAPWLLAAGLLVLLAPILRAAERRDPFWEGAARRLGIAGVLLLVGIPVIKAIQFLAAEAGSSGTFSGPLPEPSLTIALTDFLPGLLLLVLAGVFRRGAELRDFEAHAI